MKITMPKERPSDKIKLDVDLPQEDEFAVSNYVNISHYNFFFFLMTIKNFILRQFVLIVINLQCG